MIDASTDDCGSKYSRTITVPELGECVCRLDRADIEAIQEAGRGQSGVVFPPRHDPAAAPWLDVRLKTGGRCIIKAGSVVGFVSLPSGRVLHIEPKVGSQTGVFWLLVHALDLARLVVRWPELPRQRGLLDNVLLLLRHEVRKLVHAGLRKDYVEVEETSGYVRGRVLPARTLAETRGLAHRVTCLYDEHTADVFDNRVLRLALHAGAAASPALRAELLGTDALFDGEVTYERSDIGLAADQLQKLLEAKHPSRAAYQPAHSLAYLVLRLLSAGGDGRAWRQPGILLDMPKLFEEALKNMLTREFGHLGFGRHKFEFEGSPVSLTMDPDISLRGLLVDAKYYREPLHQRDGEDGAYLPRSGNLYQAHTYSFFSRRPCALVYAVGDDTLDLGLRQAAKSTHPRVGLFGLNISGGFPALEVARKELIRQLHAFQTAT